MSGPPDASGPFDTYTRDLRAEDLQRLFTRDAREASRFFTILLLRREIAAAPVGVSLW